MGTDPEAIVAAAREALAAPMPAGRVPELWDGRAAERILDALGSFTDAAVSQSRRGT